MIRLLAIPVAAAAIALGACSAEADPPADTAASGPDTESGNPPPAEAPGRSSPNGEPDEVDDVTVIEHRTDQFGYLEAVLTITNNSPEPSSYIIEVEFVADGVPVASGIAAPANIQPDATGQATTIAAIETPPGEIDVSLVSVDRFAA